VTRDPADRPYAGFVTRAVALVLDVVIIDVVTVIGAAIIALVLNTILPGHDRLSVGAAVTAGVVWFVTVGGYFIGFWALLGRTPGMRVMRLEVRPADGGQMGLPRASLRFVGLILAAIPFGLGFALALVDDRRQALQDKIARTVVLYAVAQVGGVVVVAAPATLVAPAGTAGPASESEPETVEGTVIPPGARPA
jgi:uncharacterized RDD family membrane protein YckC